MTMKEILDRMSDIPGFKRPEATDPTDFSKMSSAGLSAMYEAIKRALADDDSKGHNQTKDYGVRDTADWRDFADAIEKELDSRKFIYKLIFW